MLFDVFGPLDWRREDLRDARRIAFESTEKKALGDFVLFPEPGTTTGKTSGVATTEEEVLALFDPGRRVAVNG